MTEVTAQNFGFLIAYILPGTVVLAALSDYSETVRSWFGASPATAPTVGGFLYVTLASVVAGMTVSAFRWLVLDPLHHATGIRQPDWDFAALPEKLDAFLAVVENHYRYFQFYGNMSVALIFYVILRAPLPPLEQPALFDFAMFALIGLFYVASRDTLAKYYERTTVLLNTIPPPERSAIMTNGFGTEEHYAEKRKPVHKPSQKKAGQGKSLPKAKPPTGGQATGRK